MRNRLWCSWFLLLGALAFSAAPSLAQGRGHGRGHRNGKHGNQLNNEQDLGRSFQARDREIISRYFAGGYGNLPPGLAKRGGSLPPGLEKQLVRNGHLPPGLEKRFIPFPPELERELPPCPPEYRRGFIGGDAVIIDRKTNVIVDVAFGVAFPGKG